MLNLEKRQSDSWRHSRQEGDMKGDAIDFNFTGLIETNDMALPKLNKGSRADDLALLCRDSSKRS